MGKIYPLDNIEYIMFTVRATSFCKSERKRAPWRKNDNAYILFVLVVTPLDFK